MPSKAPIPSATRYQRELIGCWKNLPFGKDCEGVVVGGEEAPLSYNIMPIPETSDKDGYILKNFRYFERMHVNNDNQNATLAISACAPNRGGQINQIPHAIFYEQQVRFAEGPQTGDVVHVENGTWLWLPRFVQQPGPYPEGTPPPVLPSLQQPTEILIAKQIAVPHGNSVLALGSIDTSPVGKCAGGLNGSQVLPGKPVIPDGAPPFPFPEEPEPIPPGTPIPAEPNDVLNANHRYSTLHTGTPADRDFQNPIPQYTLNPNLPLQEAVDIIDPDKYMHWHVTTLQQVHGKGDVIDIPFELRVADVVHYFADYWLLFKGEDKYLAYSQTILMKLNINGKRYIFPHVTCNTLTHCKPACETPAPCTPDAERKAAHTPPAETAPSGKPSDEKEPNKKDPSKKESGGKHSGKKD